MLYRAQPCGCERERGMSRPVPIACKHANSYRYTKDLNRTSEKREGQVRKQGSTLKRGRGFAASPAQQKKVRDLPCVVCGLDRHEATIDPAHILRRGQGGCDHPDCVVPLCREHHRLFDENALDILVPLLTRRYGVEMAHPISEHDLSPTQLLERLTGQDWQPVDRREEVEASRPKLIAERCRCIEGCFCSGFDGTGKHLAWEDGQWIPVESPEREVAA